VANEFSALVPAAFLFSPLNLPSTLSNTEGCAQVLSASIAYISHRCWSTIEIYVADEILHALIRT
jgi:hypothetical protein